MSKHRSWGGGGEHIYRLYIYRFKYIYIINIFYVYCIYCIFVLLYVYIYILYTSPGSPTGEPFFCMLVVSRVSLLTMFHK